MLMIVLLFEAASVTVCDVDIASVIDIASVTAVCDVDIASVTVVSLLHLTAVCDVDRLFLRQILHP